MKFITPFVVLILDVTGIFGYISSDTANQSSNYVSTEASSNAGVAFN